jgi:cell fate (sporulation/competence/biofilm development) regulator YmcA (YheA/YmcA/DUF963 family)
MFGREKIAEAARELADHLQIVENVKALQQGQKEISDAIMSLDDRIRTMEIEFRVLKAETTTQAIKETTLIVNAVQGSLNQRIEELAIKVAVFGNSRHTGTLLETRPNQSALADRRDGDEQPR